MDTPHSPPGTAGIGGAMDTQHSAPGSVGIGGAMDTQHSAPSSVGIGGAMDNQHSRQCQHRGRDGCPAPDCFGNESVEAKHSAHSSVGNKGAVSEAQLMVLGGAVVMQEGVASVAE